MQAPPTRCSPSIALLRQDYLVENSADMPGGAHAEETAGGSATDSAKDASPFGGGTWSMRRRPKGTQLDEKGGKDYTALVVKHAMISRSCKQVRPHCTWRGVQAGP